MNVFKLMHHRKDIHCNGEKSSGNREVDRIYIVKGAWTQSNLKSFQFYFFILMFAMRN